LQYHLSSEDRRHVQVGIIIMMKQPIARGRLSQLALLMIGTGLLAHPNVSAVEVASEVHLDAGIASFLDL
jgi:hypothetical protein